MDRSPKQLQELTLALLYLTSLQDHDDPAGRRCWKGYDFQVLEDLKAQGLLQDTQGRIPLRLPQEGVAQAQPKKKKSTGAKRSRVTKSAQGIKVSMPSKKKK